MLHKWQSTVSIDLDDDHEICHPTPIDHGDNKYQNIRADSHLQEI